MTGEFSTYECEEPMECGEQCDRLYGHKDGHVCAGHRKTLSNAIEVTVHSTQPMSTLIYTDKEAQI